MSKVKLQRKDVVKRQFALAVVYIILFFVVRFNWVMGLRENVEEEGN